MLNEHNIVVTKTGQGSAPAEIWQCSELTWFEKALYNCLRGFLGRDKRCFPNNASLARRLGVEKCSIRRSMIQLEMKEFIYRVPRQDGKSGREIIFRWHAIFDSDGDAHETR